jgi:60 kDa SS-A/Ro ribonucleoprotein
MSKSSYLTENVVSTRETPQSEPLPGQVANSAGGFSYAVDDLARLRRFLILGSEGGSYYANERDLTRENIDAVKAAIDRHGPAAVAEIVAVSKGGRAPKNDPALLALAYAISVKDADTRRAAAEALPEVARIGTHLYTFLGFAEKFRGWGRTLRWAVQNWYKQDAERLALQSVKYRQRNGWTHRDALRLAHPAGVSDEHSKLYRWITKGLDPEAGLELPRIVEGHIKASVSETPEQTAALIREYNLPREAINSDHLTSVEVWDALLHAGKGMPMTAMIRNLANMTRVGLLAPGSDGTRKVIEALGDADVIRKARVHPIAVLMAMRTYGAGRGFRGSNTWEPVVQIVDALDAAFYTAFGNVTPSNKRLLLALDVSGSMEAGEVAGVPGLSPRDASAAMALVTAATEKSYEAVGFTGAGTGHSYGGYRASRNSLQRGMKLVYNGIESLPISPRQRLNDAIKLVSDLPFGGTDCSLPMQYALDKGREIDTFVVYTDSETWAGGIHPSQALRKYREQTGINAKLIVVAMTSNGFSIADPDDPGMLDVVGFDAATPQLITDFSVGLEQAPVEA